MADLSHEKLLTINNITKICSDTIYTYTDNYGSEILFPFQWHLFQLYYILDYNKISHYDPITKNLLTRSQIYNLLVDKYKSNKINIFLGNNVKKFKKVGLVSAKRKNEFSIDNFGGLPKNDIKIDKNLNDVKWSDTNEFLFEEKYNELKTNIILKKKDVVDWIMTKTMRMENSEEFLKDNPDKFLNIGRLDFYKNSSYADVILFLIALYYNDLDNLLLQSKKKYDKDFFIQNQSKLCEDTNEENTVIILNYVLDTYNELITKLNNKEIFNSHKLLLSMKMCDENNISIIGDSNFIDCQNFLINLFNILNIPIINYNIKKTYYFDNGKYNIFENLDTFTTDTIPSTNADGSSTYKDFKVEVEKGSNNKLMLFDIDIVQLSCIKSKLYEKSETDQTFDEECQVNLSKLEKYQLVGLKITNLQKIQTNLSSLISYKKQEKPNNLYFLNPDYEQLESEKFRFYKKSQPSIILDEKDLKPDIGYKIDKIVNSYELDDTNNYIMFNLLRLQKIGLRRNQIIPDEMIKINKKKYKLTASITYDKNHFTLFFNKNNKWYVYDDLYDTIKRMDYIDEIGKYEDLIKYQNSLILSNGILHLYIIE